MNYVYPETAMIPLSSAMVFCVMSAALGYLVCLWCGHSEEAEFKRINRQYRELVEDAADDGDWWKKGDPAPY